MGTTDNVSVCIRPNDVSSILIQPRPSIQIRLIWSVSPVNVWLKFF
jgi:hypothetical protein